MLTSIPTPVLLRPQNGKNNSERNHHYANRAHPAIEIPPPPRILELELSRRPRHAVAGGVWRGRRGSPTRTRGRARCVD